MISLRGVSHRYGDRLVLDRVDLDLAELRIGVVGANGSGKSTLARTLNGLVLPGEGQVRVHGLDPGADGARVRRLVGFVFTDPDAQIVMPTVAEDVAFSLRRRGLTTAQVQQRVREVLGRFGLADHADHPCHLLSGGQKQLLALASVLVTEPRTLVLDEPTTLLDLRNARRIAALVAALPQQVVLVTHHLELVEDFDRVVVLDAGRVVADGVPAQALAAYERLMSAPAPTGAP